jgi:hypothetical protein
MVDPGGQPDLSAQLNGYIADWMEQLRTGGLTVFVGHRDLSAPGAG